MLQTVYTQICERDMEMALRTLPTILKFIHPSQKLVIIDDGSLSADSAATIAALADNVILKVKKDRDAMVLEALKGKPNCIKYRNEHPLSFKLLDIPIMARQESPRFTYTDSDIIYFNSCEDYFTRDVNTFLRTDAVKLSFRLQDGLLKHRWKIPYKFNSGYFSFDTAHYDLDFIEHFLGIPEARSTLWLLEQTCWSFLFERAGIAYCPAEDEFICKENYSGPEPKSLAIHMIGNNDKKVVSKEWTKPEQMKKVMPAKPRFERSRNVTLIDWVLKSAQRFSPFK
jgi:hypothetical protein